MLEIISTRFSRSCRSSSTTRTRVSADLQAMLLFYPIRQNSQAKIVTLERKVSGPGSTFFRSVFANFLQMLSFHTTFRGPQPATHSVAREKLRTTESRPTD